MIFHMPALQLGIRSFGGLPKPGLQPVHRQRPEYIAARKSLERRDRIEYDHHRIRPLHLNSTGC